MSRFFFLGLIFYSIFSHADIVDRLKKAEGKSYIHSLGSIDFIYMINLDERPEKFRAASEQLHKYGIFPYRFSAVNGWELSLEAINDVGLKYQPGMKPLKATHYPIEGHGMPSYEFMSQFGKTYFCHNMSKGSIGCALSHISVLKDAWDSGYERIWVLEDDIEAIGDPTTIPGLLDQLDALVGKDNWDVLFTDQNYRLSGGQYMVASGASERPDMDCSMKERYSAKYTLNEDINADFRKVSARFATHSMIIQRSGIKKLLEFSLTRNIFLAYDLENYLVPGIKRYSLTRDLVSNMIGAPSDNEIPLYQRKAAGIEKHFKKAENKSYQRTMEGIDFIYMINLDPRPEKFEKTINALRPYNIFPYRFSAVNGWHLNFEALDELGVILEHPMPIGPIASVYRHENNEEYHGYEIMKETGVSYYAHSLSRGAIGCTLSHLSVLQDAYDSGYHTIWIIEDDIHVVSNPHELSHLMTLLDKLEPDWDVLFTDNEIKGEKGPVPCTMIRPRPLLQLQPLEYYQERRHIQESIIKIGMRFGSASMIVRRSGMKKILDYYKKYKIYFPYDIEYFLVPGIKLYALNKDIVTNIAGGPSDNHRPAYLDNMQQP